MAMFLKWIETIRVGIMRYMAYRLDFFLQVLAPPIVFLFVKANLWQAIYAHHPGELIGGLNLQQMISYHAWALLAGLLTTSHYSINLSEEIRMGKISSYLIYPFNFWSFHTANFLAYQIIQLVVFMVGLFLFIFLGILPFEFFSLSNSIPAICSGLILSLIAGLFWFSLQFLSGILSFWLEETWMLRVVMIFLANFLGGAIIPINLFPDFWQEWLHWTPLPYLTYLPVRVFMGHPIDWGHALIIGLLYFIPLLILNSWVFRRGIRLYTGAGM